ncbi:MAG: hypothetical protein H0T54_06995 [Geodermatophilaceae bacterium]|nr:hypothetical protein [Geodermatophilaceae bacterium]
MTTTVETQAVPTDVRGRRFRAVALAVIAPIGPLAVAGIRAVLPYQTTDGNADIAAGIAANQSAESTVLWLGLLASLTLLVGVFVVSTVAVRGAPVLGTIGAVLAFAGYSSLFFAILPPDMAGLAAVQAGADHATTTGILNQLAAHPAAAFATGAFVLGHILGTVLLGAAMWKGGLVPAWAALVLIVSQPFHLVFAVIAPNGLLDAAAWTLTAIGFAAAGLALLRSSTRVTALG